MELTRQDLNYRVRRLLSRCLLVGIVAVIALVAGGLAGPAGAEDPAGADEGNAYAYGHLVLNKTRCEDIGGTWSNVKGTKSCFTTSVRVEQHDETVVMDELELVDQTMPTVVVVYVLGTSGNQYRSTIHTTTSLATRTTLLIGTTQSQLGNVGAPGTSDTYNSQDEILSSETELIDLDVTGQVLTCERRSKTLLGSFGAWSARPLAECETRFTRYTNVDPTDPGLAGRCDFLQPDECLLPWPSDHFTTSDSTTDTGLRVNLHPDSMPKTSAGTPISPVEFNRSDGFSPGNAILTWVEGIDLGQTGAPRLIDLSESLEPDSPMVIIDADTGERQLFWAELDSRATAVTDRQALMLRPGINFKEGHRYIVAMRRLKDASGATIEPNPAFWIYRDQVATSIPHFEARRAAMEEIFDTLAAAGIERDDLYLAWDFTVASQRSLSERMLHIRDDAFADLGENAPTFTVTSVTYPTVAQNANIARVVEGTIQVPRYLTGTGGAGTTFNWAGQDLPQRNGTMTANFSCRVPRSASAAEPARLSLYGHGLLGSRSEVDAGNVLQFANEHNIVFCATDWLGMSSGDVTTVGGILQNMSLFPRLADRAQQGILDFLFLGRAMKHPNGFAAAAAFQDGGVPLITSELFYDGNSQGGIMGGAATAVAQDWTRAALGVTGMNYSLLLRRSSDWSTYAAIFEPSYSNRLDQSLILTMIQMQWDRAETNGYAQHLTDDPYPNTPEHQVLMHVAFGDFQVSMWSAEVKARTIGARLRQPALAAGRHPAINPFYGIPAVPEDEPFTGSVMVYWDSGTPPPPTIDRAPTAGSDPHSKPRSQASARLQKSEFFNGVFVDVCGEAPCLAP
jgi:hypothetical protein